MSKTLQRPLTAAAGVCQPAITHHFLLNVIKLGGIGVTKKVK